jgi:hypothetical protein
MKNSIDAHIEFSFKGEAYSLTSAIDLDQLMEHGESLPDLHARLAKEHRIDTYSYLFEVMREAEIEFGNVQGIAALYLNNGTFDFDQFATAWQEHKVLVLLQPIAMRELGITDLNQHSELKNTLIQAYNLGKLS